ncbi:MAG: hypothetical protein RLZ98_1970, partial [Pseudomonadota bacterium]
MDEQNSNMIVSVNADTSGFRNELRSA